jgi:hypothetical protein
MKKIFTVAGIAAVVAFILWGMAMQQRQCMADGHDATYCSALMNAQMNGRINGLVIEQ